jgi:hypothetical protein
MGLDMYLYRASKVNGWTATDYVDVCEVIYGSQNNRFQYDQIEEKKKAFLKEIQTKITKPNMEEIKLVAKPMIGQPFCYLTMKEEIYYWRKSNQIHSWFVKNVQNNNDDCKFYFVSEEQLLDLIQTCEKIADNILLGPELLPVKTGFFFGNTEYDFYYIKSIKETCDDLKKVYETTDFSDQILMYHASW